MDSGRQLSISTVMTGQVLTDISTGVQTVAMEDTVLLTASLDGEQTESWSLTPAQAMTLAKGLGTAVGQLLRNEVDDTGKPLTPLARLKKLGNL